MKIYALICDAPGLLLSSRSEAHASVWRANEQQMTTRTRGGALVAPKQLTVQGTGVRIVPTDKGDFPYFPVRAGAQGLT